MRLVAEFRPDPLGELTALSKLHGLKGQGWRDGGERGERK